MTVNDSQLHNYANKQTNMLEHKHKKLILNNSKSSYRCITTQNLIKKE